jgi:hypothetical protein
VIEDTAAAEQQPQTPATTTALARCIGHWSFWPVYVALVLLILVWLGPWRKWANYVPPEPEYQLRLYSRGFAEETFTRPENATVIGTVVLVRDGSTEPTDGWLLCDGRRLPKAGYEALIAVAGHVLDVDGESFRVPDYRGLLSLVVAGIGSQTIPSLSTREPDDSLVGESSVVFWIKAQ